MGLVFVVFAAWIASEDKRTQLHLLGFAVAATAIYFSHLFALAVLLLLLLSYELGRLPWRRMPRKPAAIFITPPPPCASCSSSRTAAPGTASTFNLLTTAFDRLDAVIQIDFDDPVLCADRACWRCCSPPACGVAGW